MIPVESSGLVMVVGKKLTTGSDASDTSNTSKDPTCIVPACTLKGRLHPERTLAPLFPTVTPPRLGRGWGSPQHGGSPQNGGGVNACLILRRPWDLRFGLVKLEYLFYNKPDEICCPSPHHPASPHAAAVPLRAISTPSVTAPRAAIRTAWAMALHAATGTHSNSASTPASSTAP